MSTYDISIRQKLLNKIARTNSGKKIFAKIGQSLAGKRWVFIIGCYNSGTTLLQRLLLSHPSIAGMPAEGAAYTDVIIRPEELGWTRMWCECHEEIRLQSDYTSSGAKKLKSQWSWMIDKNNAEVIVEKSIVNTLHARFLNEYFNRPKFIHLVRNGYAVSEGIRRKALPSRWKNPKFHDTYPISLCAKQWAESLKEVERLRDDHIDIFEVKYEQLCEHPEKYLNQIYNYIGVSSLHEAVTEKQWLVHGNLAPIKNMNGQNISNLSPDDIKQVQNVCSELLEHYGYQVS